MPGTINIKCILLVHFWLIYLFLECSLYINSLHLHCLIYFRHLWRVYQTYGIISSQRILKRNQLNWLVARFEVFILIWQERMNYFFRNTLWRCLWILYKEFLWIWYKRIRIMFLLLYRICNAIIPSSYKCFGLVCKWYRTQERIY